jgi:prevent-host-death family protein
MQVNIHEAKTQLSKLIEAALRGEEVVIARANKPVVRLEPVAEQQPKRRIGGLKGVVKYMADDFDAPLEDFEDYM